MSVIKFGRDVFGRVGATLRIRPMSDYFLTNYERLWMNALGHSETTFRENKIATFVDRLFIANQLAYCYTYNEPMHIERLNEDDLAREPYTLEELYRQLNLIEYNVITNGGNTFLGETDTDKLKALISIAADFILQGRKVEAPLV